MEDKELVAVVEQFLAICRKRKLTVATAESCTGGLLAAYLTALPGSSDMFERGFVTYSNEAKTELLNVPAKLIKKHGAVSKAVALAMAGGALARSKAHLALAVTGIAGPDGGTKRKPAGLVHIAAALREAAAEPESVRLRHRECRFGAIGRDNVRLESIRAALSLALPLISSPPEGRRQDENAG